MTLVRVTYDFGGLTDRVIMWIQIGTSEFRTGKESRTGI
jgi:hypothetical protein